MAESLKVTLQDEDGNIYYLKTSANEVYCEDGFSVQHYLNNVILKDKIINNTGTADSTKVASALVANNLQKQIDTIKNNFQIINTTGQTIDFNSLTESAIYITDSVWSGFSNAPAEIVSRAQIYGFLRVTKYCGGACQELYDIWTGIPVLYIRRYYGGNWGSWYKFSGTAVS